MCLSVCGHGYFSVIALRIQRQQITEELEFFLGTGNKAQVPWKSSA